MNEEFCQECFNMLYPKEDISERTLYTACRNCEHVEVAVNFKIKETTINYSITDEINAETAKNLTRDPTMFTCYRVCPKCGHPFATWLEMKGHDQERELDICYICKDCFHVWE
ncbi:RNA polymerase II subunit 9 [Pseudoloma neurophilia]|uniref:RNA polymerase II subunit 9 n=1 Tax=Pseudoloma neurophilia TaxID=146866 RepID=A0A0R0M0H4_9MICR|nr:RNA polymerase II subunit 9 [Pseudoloma neurophilia]